MRPVSERFNRVVKGSHQIFVNAKIITDYQTGVAPEGVEVEIEDGDVKLTARGDIRSSIDATVLGVPWTPRPDGLANPYGREIFVETGIVYGNGDTEVISLGYYMFFTTSAKPARNGQMPPIRITGYDRMKKIIDARLTSPRAFYPGHTVRQVFDSLVLQVYPDCVIEYDFDPDGVALTAIMVAEESRFTFLKEVAAAFGKIIYFDYRGVLMVAAAPDPLEPVFEVKHGPGGVLLDDFERSISRENVYNAVCARGESATEGPVIQAVAYDNDPTSPTYYRGASTWGTTFGKVPRFFSSPLMTNRQQCRDAARNILRGAIGVPYQVDFSMVPNRALEPHDPVLVEGPDRSEIHVIDELTVPLRATAGPMKAVTKEKTNLTVGYEDVELN